MSLSPVDCEHTLGEGLLLKLEGFSLKKVYSVMSITMEIWSARATVPCQTCGLMKKYGSVPGLSFSYISYLFMCLSYS